MKEMYQNMMVLLWWEVMELSWKFYNYDAIVDRIRFGLIGCGTRNGLAMSLLHVAKENFTLSCDSGSHLPEWECEMRNAKCEM